MMIKNMVMPVHILINNDDANDKQTISIAIIIIILIIVVIFI